MHADFVAARLVRPRFGFSDVGLLKLGASRGGKLASVPSILCQIQLGTRYDPPQEEYGGTTESLPTHYFYCAQDQDLLC